MFPAKGPGRLAAVAGPACGRTQGQRNGPGSPPQGLGGSKGKWVSPLQGQMAPSRAAVPTASPLPGPSWQPGTGPQGYVSSVGGSKVLPLLLVEDFILRCRHFTLVSKDYNATAVSHISRRAALTWLSGARTHPHLPPASLFLVQPHSLPGHAPGLCLLMRVSERKRFSLLPSFLLPSSSFSGLKVYIPRDPRWTSRHPPVLVLGGGSRPLGGD